MTADMIRKDAALKGYDTALSILNNAINAVSEAKAIVLQYGSEPEQRWIPCSERLPEEETIYLVTFASGQVGISSWHKSTKHNRGFDNVMQAVPEKGSITIYGVVAWMPLPEPYKGEQP